MVDIVVLDNTDANYIPSIIIITFVSLIHLAAFVIFLSNLKFSWVKRFIKFKSKRVKLTSLDVPKIFEDFDTHYEEYREIVNNYKRNRQYLLNQEYIQEDFDEIEKDREIKPYNIMVDFKETIAEDYNKRSMLLTSKLTRGESKIIQSKLKAETYLSFHLPDNHDDHLFQNEFLNEIFDKNKDVTDKYQILEKNRRRTMTMLSTISKTRDKRSDTTLMIENIGQMATKKQNDQDKMLSRYLQVDEHNTAANMKKINPMMTQNYVQGSNKNMSRLPIQRNSLNLRESSINEGDKTFRINGLKNVNDTFEESIYIKETKNMKGTLHFYD